MIKVTIKQEGNEIKSLSVTGHALYAKYNEDIVCAGVSAIVFGGINAMEDYKDDIDIIQKENELGFIVNKSNPNLQLIINTIIVQLKTIEESYSKNIKIIYGGV